MKLAKPFFCVPAGEIYPREIAAGEDCPPELEAVADTLGLLVVAPPADPPVTPPLAPSAPASKPA